MVLQMSEVSTEKNMEIAVSWSLKKKKKKINFHQQIQLKILSTEMWDAGQKYITEHS